MVNFHFKKSIFYQLEHQKMEPPIEARRLKLFANSDNAFGFPQAKHPYDSLSIPFIQVSFSKSHIEFHLCLMRAAALLFSLFCDVLAKLPSFTAKQSGGACCSKKWDRATTGQHLISIQCTISTPLVFYYHRCRGIHWSDARYSRG